jgi:hypothetical protein
MDKTLCTWRITRLAARRACPSWKLDRCKRLVLLGRYMKTAFIQVSPVPSTLLMMLKFLVAAWLLSCLCRHPCR